MERAERTSLRQILAKDLAANAGGSGTRAMLWAWLANPGFAAIGLHRVALHCLDGRFPKLGWLLWAFNTRRTGCHFNLGAKIGAGLFLPHPVGVVIGSGVEVAEDVCLYQGVTLGRNRKGGYPRIGTGATLFPNVVAVGDIRVGIGAVIGATAMVQADVPDHATIVVSQTQTVRLPDRAAPVAHTLHADHSG
jgi:serine O-acetyltransferase